MSRDLSKIRDLWQSGRPHTGLYSFILTGYGFSYHGKFGWAALLAMIVFALVSMSVMRYNDLVDANNDRRKGKWFATIHRPLLQVVWRVEAMVIIIGLTWLYMYSQSTALFIGMVWLISLGYSHIPHLFITQNVVVAVCSGSPALTVAAYQQAIAWNDFYTFALFTSLIWLSEVHKDIEDAKTDVGYKDTWATRQGVVGAMLLLVPSLHIVGAFFFWHPNSLLQVVAVTLVPWMAYQQAQHLLSRVEIGAPMTTMNNVIKACGVALFVPLLFA